jgi:Tfp pilus assembly protein PilW
MIDAPSFSSRIRTTPGVVGGLCEAAGGNRRPLAGDRTEATFRGFTLGEVLAAMALSAIIGLAMFAAVSGLRRSFQATEEYSGAQAGQARLLGAISRDLRKVSGTGAILSPSISAGAFTPLGSALTTSNTLTLVIPCYYSSATGNGTNPLVYVSGTSIENGALGYGPSSAIATGTIQYFKTGPANAQSFVRVESEGGTSSTSTIVEHADGMLLEIASTGSAPPAYILRVRFTPAFRTKNRVASEPAPGVPNGYEITTTDWVALRMNN